MLNFTDLFREEKEIYVQNISGMQISVPFDMGGGRQDSHTFDNSSRPVCLTQYIPFDAIKRSIDFRKLVTRRPPLLTIITEDDYLNYYKKFAEDSGLFTKVSGKKVPDVEAAIDRAEADRRAIRERQPLPDAKPAEPLHDVVEDDPRLGGHKIVKSAEVVGEDIINPRVLHLCNQVKNEIPENERMPAAELLRELKSIQNMLKLDDYEYVRAHGYYASVKKFAKAQMESLAKGEDTESDG